MNLVEKSRKILLFIALFSAVSVFGHDAANDMSEAAQEFINKLSAEQREKAVFPLKSEERFNWNYVPKDRKGIPFKELSKSQKDAAHGLMDSALSHRGFVEATTIMSLETILHDLENNNPRRDPGLYYLSFFGSPTNSTWGWRFEGHHLSMNFTIVDGKEVSVTPSFFGSNPAEVKSGPRAGLRPLGEVEDLGRKLLHQLDDDQKKIAVIATNAPAEIITKSERRVKPLSPAGLPLVQMNREQAQTLIALVKQYIYRYRSEIADDDWKKISDAGIETIYFAWAGGSESGQPHYFRVQGPTFLMEYDNTQNHANHIHCVWRNFKDDFGEDLLRRHYETSHSAQ